MKGADLQTRCVQAESLELAAEAPLEVDVVLKPDGDSAHSSPALEDLKVGHTVMEIGGVVPQPAPLIGLKKRGPSHERVRARAEEVRGEKRESATDEPRVSVFSRFFGVLERYSVL